MKKTVLIIVIVFVAVLAGSVWFQVARDPDFTGFGDEEQVNAPVVNYLSGDGDQANAGEAPPFNWKNHPVFVVGDSLTEGARKEIEKAVGDATVDGKASRTMGQGLRILEDWADGGILPDDAIIVVCLAHNITGSTISDAEQIVGMMKSGQSLIMMTGHGNSNMDPINEYIRSLPRAYAYIAVADWDLTIAQSPSLLSSDGVHIAKRQGNELYAELILRALEVASPKP